MLVEMPREAAIHKQEKKIAQRWSKKTPQKKKKLRKKENKA